MALPLAWTVAGAYSSAPPGAFGLASPRKLSNSSRCRCQVATSIVSGLAGLTAISITPVLSSSSGRTFFQVLPPSVVLNSPRSPPGPYSRPRAPTNTVSGLVGWIQILPIWYEAFRPMFFQVLPPSVDLYTPSPNETELRGLASPVLTHTTSLLDGATATAPTDTVASRSNWCS